MLAVASMLENHKKIQFLILGDGAGKKKLLDKNEELNLSNVRFGELVAESHLNLMLNGSDIQLVLQKKMAGDSFLPSKYINILSAGIPSVITAQKGTALYTMATENKTSIVVEAENTTMLAEAVLRLFNKKEFRKRLAKNSRMLALQSYGKDEILNNLQQTYMRMLN
jgi:colanic acid biosynthesis glycosyl transferase WcaI